MMLDSVELGCPYCRAELQKQNPEEWQCASCDRKFPVIFGIPDLRVFADPYVDFETDREKAALLASHFDELSFEEMVRFYYLTTAVVPHHHAMQFTRGILAAESRAEFTLQEWEGGSAVPGPFLEIGCGTGPLLIAGAKRGWKMTGVDIALRWLVVAKKRLQQAGFEVPVICACAEALPFSGDRYATVTFDSTLEVVADQNKALVEASRVLTPGGELLIHTPNRYSPGPDPHINLWAGGFLPDRWVAAYARRQNAIPPKRVLLIL